MGKIIFTMLYKKNDADAFQTDKEQINITHIAAILLIDFIGHNSYYFAGNYLSKHFKCC